MDYRRDISECVGQVVGPDTTGQLYHLHTVEPLGNGRWRAYYSLAGTKHLQATSPPEHPDLATVAGRTVQWPT